MLLAFITSAIATYLTKYNCPMENGLYLEFFMFYVIIVKKRSYEFLKSKLLLYAYKKYPSLDSCIL